MKIHFVWLTALLALATGCGQEAPAPAPQEEAATSEDGGAAGSETAADILAQDLARHIEKLASDAFEGRAPMTPGGERARDYIAGEYKRLGLEPVNGSYFQSVPLVESTLDPEQSYFRVAVNGELRELAYKTESVYWTKRIEGEVSFDDSQMVFVGYGIVAPEYGWDDYEGIDAAGKTVVILVNDPGYATQDPKLFNGNAMTYYGRWTYKYEEAARQGAAAAIIIHQTAPAGYGWGVVESSWSGAQLDLQRKDDGASRIAVESWITEGAARELLAASGLDLDALKEAAASADFKAVHMGSLRASAKLVQIIRRSEDANVLGVLPGAERPGEYVLYMAHWDHLGVDSAAEGEDKIFNGAVDNATGIAAILEIAERFARNEQRPERSVLFAAVTAEESGLLGSAYMAEDPPVPLSQIVGGFNIDGMLPAPPAKDITVVGYGASELEDLLKTAAANHDRYLRPDPEPEKGYFYRSDHISLAKTGVPMLYADSGIDLRDGGEEAGKAVAEDYVANRYHAPSDEYDDSWDLSGMADTVQVLYETGATLAYSKMWPNWHEGNEFRVLRDAQRAGGQKQTTSDGAR